MNRGMAMLATDEEVRAETHDQLLDKARLDAIHARMLTGQVSEGMSELFSRLLQSRIRQSRGCPRFCVNGPQAGNCHLTRRHNDYVNA
jgi:hypothetical protein